MAKPNWMRSLNRLLQLKGMELHHEMTRTSAVTTAWGVYWDEDNIARDLIQNFFDANRGNLSEVKVEVKGSDVTISAPSTYNLQRLFYLGSEKGEHDVGEYGEGFKAAAVNLLRDHGVELIAVSCNRCVHIHLSDEIVEDTQLQPVVYDFYQLPVTHDGTLLLLPDCSDALANALQNGLTHFLYDGNPLIGPELWSSPGRDFVVYESNCADGFAFYRNLKRGEIPGIPLVLVINGVYAEMEKLVHRDRDRNAFGERMMKAFYRLFVKTGINGSHDCVRLILERSRPCWIKGQPLLGLLAASSWERWRTEYGRVFVKRSLWSEAQTVEVFGEGYFARSDTFDPAQRLEYRRLERGWANNGKIKLKAYFKHFGVLNAEDYCLNKRERAAKENQRTPTPAESNGIKLLAGVLEELAPELMQVFARRTVTYSVFTSHHIHGEFKKQQRYRSLEVSLEQSVFVDDFPGSFATFLHEHAHVFGHDGSRGFTDALTDLLATVVRRRHLLDDYSRDWKAVRGEVIKERLASSQDGEEPLAA